MSRTYDKNVETCCPDCLLTGCLITMTHWWWWPDAWYIFFHWTITVLLICHRGAYSCQLSSWLSRFQCWPIVHQYCSTSARWYMAALEVFSGATVTVKGCANDSVVVFVRSFHQGRRLTVSSLSTCLQLPPALRPRHGPVRNSPLTLRLVLYIYRA